MYLLIWPHYHHNPSLSSSPTLTFVAALAKLPKYTDHAHTPPKGSPSSSQPAYYAMLNLGENQLFPCRTEKRRHQHSHARDDEETNRPLLPEEDHNEPGAIIPFRSQLLNKGLIPPATTSTTHHHIHVQSNHPPATRIQSTRPGPDYAWRPHHVTLPNTLYMQIIIYSP